MSTWNSKARLLIVEDEAVIAMDLEARLSALRYDVCGIASTSEEALALAHDYRPELVIMDIRLADTGDGVKAAGEIREVVGIPHVYLTSYTDPATLARAQETRPLAYLVKPFTNQHLNSTVELALYRHRTERRIYEHREWLDSLWRRIPEAVITLDERGYIRSLNASAESLTGFRSADASGKPVTAIWPASQADSSGSRVDPCCYGTTMTVVCDVPDGSQRQDQIRAATQLTSMEQLAAGLAHSFNEQLTVILTAVEAGQHALQSGRSGLAQFEQISKSSRVLRELVSDLGMLAHNQAPSREPIDLNQLVEDCSCHVIRPVLSQAIELEIECRAQDPIAFVDRKQIEQALLNLVLSIRERTDPPRICSIHTDDIASETGEAMDATIAIWVADTILDLADRGVDCCWEFIPLREDTSAELTQTTADELVRQNGGSLQRLRGAQEATMFRIVLPRFRYRRPPPTAAQLGGTGRRLALVVDDSEEIRRVVCEMLADEGYETLDAGSAEEGLAIAAYCATAIDVLVADMVLPGLNGAELGVRLMQLNPSVHVILTSGYTERQLAALWGRAERASFLRKPFTAADFRGVIASFRTPI